MSGEQLTATVREAGPKILAALAARYRDLDLAEEAYGEALARAAASWPNDPPRDGAAWLYRVASRAALDAIRKLRRLEPFSTEPPDPAQNAEETLADDATLIPDERLRLIFVCCHPAVAAEARAALTLKLVCGLSTTEISRAFLLAEPALAQRLVRAKRKISEAGVPFEVPGPEAWPERLDAVLSTLEIAYGKAHEDAAGAGPHAGYAFEMLALTKLLCELLPAEPEAFALAATVRYAEARRPARLDSAGAMVPLSDQDPALWRADLIADADAYLDRAAALGRPGPRGLQAAIHSAWCARKSLAEPAPWRQVLMLYDILLTFRDDAVIRLNRAVALAEVAGVAAALDEIGALPARSLDAFLPYHAVRADLLRRAGRPAEARQAYEAALGLDPSPAERRFLAEKAARLE